MRSVVRSATTPRRAPTRHPGDGVLRRAPARVTWLNCPVTPGGPATCRKEVGASDIRVRIVSLPVQAKNMFHDSVFGFAIAPALASVYYQSAQRLAKLDNANFETPVILGCVIAHETGHLLLGPNSHSPTGIMQSQWERKQLRQAMMGGLLFNPEQADPIRAQAQTRTEVQAASLKSQPRAGVDQQAEAKPGSLK